MMTKMTRMTRITRKARKPKAMVAPMRLLPQILTRRRAPRENEKPSRRTKPDEPSEETDAKHLPATGKSEIKETLTEDEPGREGEHQEADGQ